MRTNHTPGPWVIGVSHVAGEYAIREGADPTDREPQCLAVVIEIGDAVEQAKANARLIAAAPDLLAALESMLRLYTSTRAIGDRPGAVEAAYDALNKARQA